MKAFFWVLTHLKTVMALAKDAVIAVQAVGTYLSSDDAEKKLVAVQTLKALIKKISPLDEALEERLSPLLGFIIEMALKIAKREAITWESVAPAVSRTANDLIDHLAKRGPEALTPVPNNFDALVAAAAEYQELERRNARLRTLDLRN